MGQSIKSAIGKYAGVVAVKLSNTKNIRVYSVAVVALIGVSLLFVSNAATFSIGVKPQSGGDCVQNISDSNASGGNAIQFCTAATGGSGSPGAHLPIQYNISDLTGTIRYVDDTGSDSAAGTASAPFATLAKAISASAAGDSIVVKGGTYRQGGLSGGGNLAKVTKKLNIYAASGETPVFIGSRVATSWTTSGSLKYTDYTEMTPDTSGDYATADPIGKNADQAWVGSKRLKQVSSQAEVVDGKFWVDASGNKLYMTANDVNKGNVEVSNYDQLFQISAANVRIEGLSIQRYSDPSARFGVIRMEATSDNSTISNVEILDSAEMALKATGNGGSNLNTGVTLKNVTISGSGWMGVNTNQTDNFTMDSVKITNLNLDGEYKSSPQSGALKTSRTRYTKVLNSEFSNINSVALWFDQSNFDVDVANNTITGATGASIFFEISDDLLMVNNFIDSTSGVNAVEIAGSSGVKLVNNTLVGDSDPLAFYVDKRGTPGCSTPNGGCTLIYGPSDWDVRSPIPATLDWVVKVDLMVNNVVVKTGTATRAYGCTPAPLCFTQASGTAVSAINTEIHGATSLLPQTFLDDNVYVNYGSNIIVATQKNGNYTSASAWSSFLAGSPVSISNLEAGSKSGTSWVNNNGTPTSALSAAHNQATSIPSALSGKFPTATIDNIKQYMPSGDTTHYGVLYK